MGALAVIPRRQQLTQFMEALRKDPPYERRPLFERLTDLTPNEVDDLLYNGLCSIDALVHDWERALADMELLGIESGVRDTFSCVFRAVRICPWKSFRWTGTTRLAGVNWEGTTISLVVYPAAETLSRLMSTTVHEYHHHYRTAVMNNGP